MNRLITNPIFTCLLTTCSVANAQCGPRPSNLGASRLNLGEPGIAWYTTCETAQAEAKRSGRPTMCRKARIPASTSTGLCRTAKTEMATEKSTTPVLKVEVGRLDGIRTFVTTQKSG